MATFIARRLIQAIPALIGITMIVFVMLHLSGDPIALLADPLATQEEIEVLRQAYGLDQPVHVQYINFLWQAVQLHFGESFYHRKPAGRVVMERLPASLQLGMVAVTFAVLIGLPCGILAALFRNSIIDYVVSFIVVLGQSVATFWMAMLLILFFAVYLQVLPVAGSGTPQHIILPAAALCTSLAALVTRLVRSGMLEVMRQDYIRTARAKGLPERAVVIKHALRNSLIPVVTVIGLYLSAMVGGTIIIEVIFAWPGVGSVIMDSVYRRDYPVVLAGITITASIFVLVMLVVDMLYAVIDPRIRYA